jgi:hypothetical protein
LQRVRFVTELTKLPLYYLGMTMHAKSIRKLRRDARRRALALFERQRFLRDPSRVAADPEELLPRSSPSSR